MKRLLVSAILTTLLSTLFLTPASTVKAEAPWTGIVTAGTLNVRPAPNTRQAPIGELKHGDTVTVLAAVPGEVVRGDEWWYQIGPGQYVYAMYVARASSGSADFGPGERWIEINLTNKMARAMVDEQAVYSADVTIGRPGWGTPVGNFSIVKRVQSETMDSSTIGIPRESPDGYYLTDVLYTQYFLWTGQALHYNYWVSDEAFGNAASSRGCIGLRLEDAKFFWEFARVGTPVVIHY